MPILERRSTRAATKVAASATLELMWVLHNCQAKHVLSGPLASLEPLRQQFATRLRSFWEDGVHGFTEAVVLAEWGGTLLDFDLDRFFSTLDKVAASGGDEATLLSETAAERRAIDVRLKRLSAEPELRVRYRTLLQEVWEPLHREWDETGRAAVTAAASDWTRRLAEGADFRALLERPRIWPGRPELDELADSAANDDRLVLSPGWFFGEIHVVELGGNLYLGRGIRTQDHEAMRRETSTRVAGNLKALADPTRLNILLWLANKPSSVTEVAKHFDLSQPTVSAHVQILRDAGLVEDRPNGRSSQLILSEQRLKDLFEDAEKSLLHLFPHGWKT